MSRLAGKTVVFTGTIDGFTRDECVATAQSLGARVSGSVRRGVDLVVAGPGAGSKLKKANELGIEVIEREQWVEITSPSPTGSRLTGVGGVFCASHGPNGVPVHGHTWQVIAWFPMGEAEALRDRLQDFLSKFDHTHLPDHLAWGEDMAQAIGTALGAVRVQVNRPMEHIYAEWSL